MLLNELIKQLQVMKRDFGGNIEVCVCTDLSGRFGLSVDYPEVVDVRAKGRREEFEYAGDATLDGPGKNADEQAVFIYSV